MTLFREIEKEYDEIINSDQGHELVHVSSCRQYMCPVMLRFGKLILHMTRAESIRFARALLDANKALPPQVTT